LAMLGAPHIEALAWDDQSNHVYFINPIHNQIHDFVIERVCVVCCQVLMRCVRFKYEFKIQPIARSGPDRGWCARIVSILTPHSSSHTVSHATEVTSHRPQFCTPVCAATIPLSGCSSLRLSASPQSGLELEMRSEGCDHACSRSRSL
jgi:hypothetical protein